ncbi:uncharacterized protein [Choristoneura fumiferana]|uniref:uncharacterized protein n=1 Tax=Choristoneura fumiferana TaxID=7141 RepID=UPI003D155EFD
MFQTSLFCTMLTICRYLSPSLKTADYIMSDIYIYSCINIRPLFMAKMCALISDQKDKTLLMLLSVLVQGDLDDVYRDQIQSLINLVGARKMEITANVFTADVQTAVNFSGRVVSYTVLMIQYFYKFKFLDIEDTVKYLDGCVKILHSLFLDMTNPQCSLV